MGKPSNPLEIWYHPKHNTLYIVLQNVMDNITGYYIIFIIQCVHKNDAILCFECFSKLCLQNKRVPSVRSPLSEIRAIRLVKCSWQNAAGWREYLIQ